MYEPGGNNHVYSYPDSGPLKAQVYVTGNPEPNTLTLWVQRDESSARVPVSSQDFTWYYATSGNGEIGLIQVSVTGGLESGSGVTRYILEAGNGVVGGAEFEYKFTVQDENSEFVVDDIDNNKLV